MFVRSEAQKRGYERPRRANRTQVQNGYRKYRDGLFLSLYIFLCLRPLKVQARLSWPHTSQRSEVSV